MTTITPASSDTGPRAPRATRAHGDEPSPEGVTPPPKLQRRPFLWVVGLAALLMGAAASAWIYQSSSDTREVLAVRSTVERGQVITKADLMSVRISVDPALDPLSTSEAADVVGKRAALDLVAGGVVTADQVTDATIPAEGQSVVGLKLTSAMLPAEQVRVGDQVRIVTTSGTTTGAETTTATPSTVDAEVVGIAADATSGDTILNVQVPHDDAPVVADRAASGRVAVVLDSGAEQ